MKFVHVIIFITSWSWFSHIRRLIDWLWLFHFFCSINIMINCNINKKTFVKFMLIGYHQVIITFTTWTQLWVVILVILPLLIRNLIYMGKLHPKPNWSIFCTLSQNYQHFLKNNMCILKQIVWETHKWHYNFSGPSGP